MPSSHRILCISCISGDVIIVDMRYTALLITICDVFEPICRLDYLFRLLIHSLQSCQVTGCGHCVHKCNFLLQMSLKFTKSFNCTLSSLKYFKYTLIDSYLFDSISVSNVTLRNQVSVEGCLPQQVKFLCRGMAKNVVTEYKYYMVWPTQAHCTYYQHAACGPYVAKLCASHMLLY